MIFLGPFQVRMFYDSRSSLVSVFQLPTPFHFGDLWISDIDLESSVLEKKKKNHNKRVFISSLVENDAYSWKYYLLINNCECNFSYAFIIIWCSKENRLYIQTTVHILSSGFLTFSYKGHRQLFSLTYFLYFCKICMESFLALKALFNFTFSLWLPQKPGYILAMIREGKKKEVNKKKRKNNS